MLATERQQKINEILQKNGAVTTADLMETFGVSIETVRRDLLLLEQQGRLSRVHGGAVAKNDMTPFSDLEQRNLEFVEQKNALSERAMAFINEGDVIAVDEGSTAMLFAKALKAHFDTLTVITHSLDVFQALNHHKNFTLILCGGHFLPQENAFYGPLVLESLCHLHAQKVFIFPSAVSLEHGIADYQSDLFPVQKQLFSVADSVFVLADSSKFEKTALLKVADMNDEYTYITDDALSDDLAKLYAENGKAVYRADPIV